MDLEKKLFDMVFPIIQEWDVEGIYAISFFVYVNEANEYNGCSNFPEFSIGYNTEEDCEYADELSEERWNYAFWNQDMTEIIAPDSENEGAKLLFEWYKENGILNIGYEDEHNSYDDNMNYSGKGPNGYYELLCAVSNVARKLQKGGSIRDKFGIIPIIVHDLEYTWFVKEATENANPNGEANLFLKYLNI
jgi:hypothetical protein